MPGVKRSLLAGQAASQDSDEEDHAQGSTSKRIRISDNARHYELSDDEETDEEIQNLQATQMHEKQRSRRQDQNGPAENGIIESITLTNFMCHSFLHVDIGPLINFIIGHNGSGKSAVLTALTVCLGGKASATNRASSLKSFIKEGAETCTLSVKIKNGGDDGYQQEIYGNSIIVERSFSKSGASAFKVKNSSGRIISTKRSDLEDISDYYALQLDNPINVLTQDNARQFLSGSNPTEKYKFFIRGVQLEQLNRDYDLLHESIAQMETTFEDKRIHVRQLKDAKDRAKATHDLLNQSQNMYTKIHFVRSQIAWAQVEEQEGLLRQAEDELRSIASQMANIEAEVDEAGTNLLEAEQARDMARQEHEHAQQERDKTREELTRSRDSQTALKDEAVNAQRDERSIDEDIKTNERYVANAKADMEIERARLEEVNGGSITRFMSILEEKKTAVDLARQKHRDHVSRRDNVLKSQADVEAELKSCELRERAKAEEIAFCENRLRDMQKQGQRRSFKPNMNRLINAINASKEFREQPVGPIGEHIQLKDPQWLSIIERSFGDTLEAFIVTSKSDQNRLTELMRQIGCQTSVVIGSRASIDTSNHEPDPQFNSILRVLRIDNDIVKRQLVINQGIEQTILIPSIKDAREIMDRNRLTNVKQCFSHQPHTANAGERFSYGIGGSLNSSFVPAWNKAPRMRTQIEDLVAFERNSLQRLERDMQEINDELRQLKIKLNTCKQKVNAHDRDERSLKIDIQTAQHLCDEIQEKIDANNIEEGRLDALKEALRVLEEEGMHLKNIHNDALREKEKQTLKWKAMEPEIRAIEGRIRNLETDVKKTNEEVRRKEEARQTTLFRKNAAHEKLSGLEHRQRTTEQDRVQQVETIADFSRQASTVGQRVPIDEGETADSLMKKLEKLESELRNQERRVGGDIEQITREYQQATARHAEAFTQVETEEKLAQLLRQTLHAREERWRLFRQKISARARATFVFVLSERSFHGHLRINHHRRKLDIAVQPDATHRDRQGREAASLSGGEKSYSTICLLLALWDAVGAPIRCLDEFDVFMDSVNREISMKLLVRAARSAAGRQFILISPQAGVVDASPDVKIIKLRDPERDQTRIPIGRATVAVAASAG